MQRMLFYLASGILVGCASAPAAMQLPDTGYTQYVRNKLTVEQCVVNGWMSPETGALANQYSDAELSRYVYDVQKLQTVWNQWRNVFQPVQGDCNVLAMHVARIKNQTDEAKELERQQQANKPVRCSTVFGVTTCY